MDGRRKLPTGRHPEVKRAYQELRSTRQVAKLFGISRRLVVFILHPERLKALKEKHRKEKHWKTYYDKEKHRIAIKKYRDKKRKAGLAV